MQERGQAMDCKNKVAERITPYCRQGRKPTALIRATDSSQGSSATRGRATTPGNEHKDSPAKCRSRATARILYAAYSQCRVLAQKFRANMTALTISVLSGNGFFLA